MQIDTQGRPYLESADLITSLPEYSVALFNKMPGGFGVPFRVATGQFDMTMTGFSGYRQSGNIDFPVGMFTDTPTVIITPRIGGPSGAYIAEAVTVTASYFQARVIRVVGAWEGSATMSWVAIQMRNPA